MLCPHCQIKMTAFFADHLELDRCPKCEGLWLDINEVERLHGLRGLTVSSTGVAAKCPRGHGALRTGGIGTLRADVCPTCRGAFIPEEQAEAVPAAVTRAAGVPAVKRTTPLTAICDTCGKQVPATDGAMGPNGFVCSNCQAGAKATPEDRAFNLIGNVLDALKG